MPEKQDLATINLEDFKLYLMRQTQDLNNNRNIMTSLLQIVAKMLPQEEATNLITMFNVYVFHNAHYAVAQEIFRTRFGDDELAKFKKYIEDTFTEGKFNDSVVQQEHLEKLVRDAKEQNDAN